MPDFLNREKIKKRIRKFWQNDYRVIATWDGGGDNKFCDLFLVKEGCR